MAERWDRERAYRRDENDYRSRDYAERGRSDRAVDEVRSWFGDDEAARRRRMDEVRDAADDRGDRYDRDRSAPGRTWDRAREAVRDATDRDRDGRRGLAEWNDNDRPRDTGRTASSIRNREDYWNRDRDYWGPPGYSSEYASRTSGPGPSSRYGAYHGRGPRGYKRGDERIREDVCDRLTDDARIDASDIDVQVKDGEVTLAGSVRTREEKRFSEDLTEHISGVRDVSNHLKVKPADEVIGTARSGASVLGLTDTPPPPPGKIK